MWGVCTQPPGWGWFLPRGLVLRRAVAWGRLWPRCARVAGASRERRLTRGRFERGLGAVVVPAGAGAVVTVLACNNPAYSVSSDGVQVDPLMDRSQVAIVGASAQLRRAR